MKRDRHLILVSNRLPLTFSKTRTGWSAQPSNGGLVSALLPIANEYGGFWIGWTGTDYESGIEDSLTGSRFNLPRSSIIPVFLSAEEKRCFYQNCANETIWPLFHGLEMRSTFDPEHWLVYREVNEKFADAVESIARRDDFVWVHDYHLMLVAQAIAFRELPLKLAYFHHIPFPAPEIFEKLPWHKELLSALLQFHTLGFQTTRDASNFLASVRRCFHDVEERQLVSGILVQAGGRSSVVEIHPISVDFHSVEADAQAPAITTAAKEMRNTLGNAKLLVGVDRLDHSKGIVERLRALEALLESHSELRGRVVLHQVTIPSREEIASYQQLRRNICEAVAEINCRFGASEWIPVVHEYRQLTRSELLALYRAADVALVTPLRDGMNLVAKEFCASRIDDSGVLLLSEFAGAAQELGGAAMLVDPRNRQSLSNAIHTALVMDKSEQQRRMAAMRNRIREHDVFFWARSVLGSNRAFTPMEQLLPVTASVPSTRSAAVV